MKPNQWPTSALAAAVLVAALAAKAQAPTPVGLWKTFNERTGQAEGLGRIVERDGALLGTVVAVFSPPARDPNPRCEQCRGKLKDQPVVGMTILHGLRRDGEQYSGGEILDPDDGAIYRFFGRTQVWVRETALGVSSGDR
jgi:uncharacterized protein (DUF2147 family)